MIVNRQYCTKTSNLLTWSYQVLSSHLANAHHAYGISWHRNAANGRFHKSTGTGGWSLTCLSSNRVMGLQQWLINKNKACWFWSDDSHVIWHICWDAAAYLEVWLVENTRELGSRVAALRKGTQLSQDVLNQLHVIVPHGLQARLLQTLCALGD